MSKDKLLMGLDISTTGAKALLINSAGDVVASANTPLTLSTPKPLWSEQNPEEWWAGMVQSIRAVMAEVDKTAVSAIGLTGQMHGLILLDKDGAVLRPAILWNDGRSQAQCDAMRQALGKERLIQITGNDALTGFTAPKLLWVRDNEPDIYASVCHLLLPKDYIRYRLTNDFALDRAGGAGTILFDLKQRSWSDEVCRALEIPTDCLPPTFEGPDITGYVTEAVAEQTGLPAGIPVVAGGGDQAAQAVGVGAVRSGIVALTLGTSGVVFATTDAPLIEPNGRLHAFCHAVPNRWHLMGVMLSAAGSLQWYRDTVAPEVPFDELVEETTAVAPGSEGLFFLPYLSGERTPHPDPLARGAFIGLTVRHTRAHMTRAVLEGVAYGLKDSFTLIQEAGLGDIEQVRLSGGGAKSGVWRQILANVLGAELVTVNTTEGGAFGAALLAGVGVGIFADVPSACDATIQLSGRTVPNEETAVYQQQYPIYQSLYPALQDVYTAVGQM